MNTIGRRIARLRKEYGLTQEELAQIMEVSSQAVSKWENDVSCPDISDRDLRAVCKAVKQVKRRYGRYELVSVESSGGDEVSIFL